MQSLLTYLTPRSTITDKGRLDTKGLRAGVYLILMGFAQICIGLTDPIFHIDRHDDHDHQNSNDPMTITYANHLDEGNDVFHDCTY